MKYIYPAIFTKEDDGIVASFPDVDGVYTDGGTYEEAYANAEDALTLMLWDMEEEGREIRKPTPVNKLKIPADSSIALIKADTLAYRRMMDTKAVRKNVSIPYWLNELATKRNINFSNVLQNALMHELGVNS